VQELQKITLKYSNIRYAEDIINTHKQFAALLDEDCYLLQENAKATH